MVQIATDLPQFLHRREIAAYEQRLARAGYAYGVDLRRATQLATSMIGDPLVRAIDRRWSRTVAELEEDCLLPQRKAPPLSLLEELTSLIQLLRAPLPSVRLLRPEMASTWAAVTPLGTTKGAIHWLVIDPARVMAMEPATRTFVLASALGHLQCDHGPIFSAFLMSHRGARLGLLKTVMRPWAKVATFSADRAGLLAVQSLGEAFEALSYLDSETVDWMPRPVAVTKRQEALADFHKSAMMTRRRVLSDPDGGGFSLTPMERSDDGSLVQRIRNAFGLWGRRGSATESTAEKSGADAEEKSEAKSAKGPEATPTTAAADAPTPKTPPAPPKLDPERAAKLEQALVDAWSLARCDARLTRKLRLP